MFKAALGANRGLKNRQFSRKSSKTAKKGLKKGSKKHEKKSKNTKNGHFLEIGQFDQNTQSKY